ncbi:MAG: 30S ribosomal protein S4e [Candidatus Thermoplasmatota archaeon]
MSLHMKRLASPRSWKIHKKSSTWVPKPTAGKHSIEQGVPLGIILRDYLKLVDTMTEAKRVLGNREVKIDGRVAVSHKAPVGLMDIVSVPKTNKNYRVVLDSHGRVVLTEVTANEANWKFCRIEDKTTVSGGRTQLNLHDGRNIIVKEKTYKTGDVVKLAVPEQEIKAHYAFGQGMTAFITGGAHVGEFAKVQSVEVIRSPRPNLVALTSGETPFSTVKNYVFLVGKDKPEIAASEVSA